MKRFTPWAAAAAVATAIVAGPALAHEDIQLTIIDGRIATGDAEYTNEFDNGDRIYIHLDAFDPHRVFEGLFDSGFFTEDPGLNSGTGQFDTPSQIGFNILSPLRRWIDQDNGFAWLDPDNDESILVTRGAQSARTGDGFVAGFLVDVRDENSHPTSPDNHGRVHYHYGFTLDRLDNATPTEGIYLLELELFQTSTDPNVELGDTSLPFWIVFGTSTISGGEIDMVMDYVQANIVPEPATLALLGMGGVALVARRRGRKAIDA